MNITRNLLLSKIQEEYEIHQVCALLGPRQCGKTTLAKAYVATYQGPVHFFDLENPLHLARFENPMTSLQDLDGLIVIDEVQLRPDLFSVLRVLVDEKKDRKFLVTGSASRDLLRQSSETLAGRIGYHQITPFTMSEVDDWKKLWDVGGFPKSYLASSTKNSERWRDEYIKTFLERDIFKLSLDITPNIVEKLWKMLAHINGQICNYAGLSKSLGIDQRTVKRYIEILEGAFMVRILKPWHTNLGKREVKSPKLYIRDTGILHRLLDLDSENLQFYPYIGHSFEGFAIEQLISHFDIYDKSYFWSVHESAELDFLVTKGMKKIGFEIKYSDAPKITKSMHVAMEDLKLDHLYIITPGDQIFQMDNKVTSVGISHIKTLKI